MKLILHDQDVFSVKKIHITFLLAILVFTIHISTFYNYDFLQEYECVGIFNRIIFSINTIAVPAFMILSAILFYRNYEWNKTLEKYRSRLFSLVIPYLLWNILSMLFSYTCSYTPLSRFFIGREKSVISLHDILQGVFFYKYTPFWFIFDLIIFVIACPVIFLFVKNKYIGAVTVFLVGYLYIKGYSLPSSVFFRGDAFFYYILGAYIGTHFWKIFMKRIPLLGALISGGICIFCGYYYFNSCLFAAYRGYLEFPIMVIFFISLWYAFDLFPNRSFVYVEKASFFIYAMHVNVSAAITKLLVFILPKTVTMAFLNYALTIVLTLAVIGIFSFVLERKFPKVYRMLGGR